MFVMIYQWLKGNKSTSILIVSVLIIVLLFLWIDLPLAKWAVKKGWRVYQLSKISGSLESLDKKIKEEEDRNVELNEKAMKSQLGQTAGSVTSIIDLINESARQSKISVLSVNSFSPTELKDYHQFPFEISLEGEYHQLGQFLNLIENSGYAVRFQDLLISTKDMFSNKLDIKLKLSVFFTKG
jgi:Tfp pilus assembly protein PilO